MPDWYLYIIRCGDQTLYTGIATDVNRRLDEHRAGGRSCAKYLRGRGPLQLVFQQRVGSQSMALKLESKVKRMSKVGKERLIREKVISLK